MQGYRISEVAERTGFRPATLRYYEDRGVVPPPARSQAGYRLYDDRALRRLRFVARAKQLGLTLEEVGDLTELWDDDECGPVQERMAGFVADKLADTRARSAELGALAGQLQSVASRLLDAPEAGACDDGCACNVAPSVVSTEVPIACTLAPSDLRGRLTDWQAVADRAVRRERLPSGVRLVFRVEAGLAATLADLAQAEHGCCGFLDFTLGIGANAITLDVQGPTEAGGLIGALTGVGS